MCVAVELYTACNQNSGAQKPPDDDGSLQVTDNLPTELNVRGKRQCILYPPVALALWSGSIKRNQLCGVNYLASGGSGYTTSSVLPKAKATLAEYYWVMLYRKRHI